ncbi:hypothetical protein [Rossellomorea vietnamensis]|uniref:Uncharacterized protein n=1 Tax=Rossellomorea vietnamensis TaxID=218284 RepID=A0A0P6VZ46_9BACI|nr:hypothetical protein [Rossellomorea vietnamensis]KPL60452.1 hypothetical protein AM506_04780 [Rossellomorea vietnamensis]
MDDLESRLSKMNLEILSFEEIGGAHMLAWEVEKYFQGHLSEKRIREIIEWKIGEIERVREDLETKGLNGRI